MGNPKKHLPFGIMVVIFAIVAAIVFLGQHKFRGNTPKKATVTTAADPNTESNSSPQDIPKAVLGSVGFSEAKQLISRLRSIAIKTNDIQVLCYGNAALLGDLRKLGTNAVSASLDEIADKASPDSLRILLIEFAASVAGRQEDRVGQVLMAVIADPEEVKAVKMQALQWIPTTGNQSAAAKILEMLLKQTDSDLEFGMTRAMKGFKVPGSINILQAELADDKNYLTRVAAYHALAKQGGPDALKILQTSISKRLAAGSQENEPEENTVSLHGLLALGELPDASSLPVLETIAENPGNSVSVRNVAVQTIAGIGGLDATRFLRRTLQAEPNESVLVYVARAISATGNSTDANACLAKAATVTDDYTKSELERAAEELKRKPAR
jgi:HEAT repeat protein